MANFMMPTIKLYMKVYFLATLVVRRDHLANLRSSRSSLPKLETTLIAVSVSSAIPPKCLITASFCMVNFLTMLPKTPMMASRTGRYKRQKPAKAGAKVSA